MPARGTGHGTDLRTETPSLPGHATRHPDPEAGGRRRSDPRLPRLPAWT